MAAIIIAIRILLSNPNILPVATAPFEVLVLVVLLPDDELLPEFELLLSFGVSGVATDLVVGSTVVTGSVVGTVVTGQLL